MQTIAALLYAIPPRIIRPHISPNQGCNHMPASPSITATGRRYSALEQAITPQLGVRLLLYCLFDLIAKWGWMINAKHRQFYPRESNLLPEAYGDPKAGLD